MLPDTMYTDFFEMKSYMNNSLKIDNVSVGYRTLVGPELPYLHNELNSLQKAGRIIIKPTPIVMNKKF